jgi:hypothetical protein
VVAFACIALSVASSIPAPTDDADKVLLKYGVIVSNGTGGNYVPDGPASAKVSWAEYACFYVAIGAHVLSAF